jgi:anion-transporting  ArsA/GET3 family ATPase
MGALSTQRLWVVTGKGGVGKSTVAAALALGSARAGQRTLVCEINAQERVSGFLGHPPVGPEIRLLEERLWAVNVQPPEAMREYALMVLRFEAVYKAVFENRFVRYFLRFIPSLQELVMLGKVLYHLDETLPDGSPRFERIVMDAPATGHAIAFLSVPQVILDTVPPGPMSAQAKKMRDHLAEPRTTATVLVSLPEEMPINETVELHHALTREVHVSCVAAVLNMFIPPRFEAAELDWLPAALKEPVRQHHTREQLSAQAKERLERELSLPVVTLARLFDAPSGRAVVEQAMTQLAPLWEAGR